MIDSVLRSSFLLADVATAPLQWRLRWNWDWPLWVTLSGAIIIALALIWLYFHEVSRAGKRVRLLLAALRMAAVALLVLMFAQPALESYRLDRPRLVDGR